MPAPRPASYLCMLLLFGVILTVWLILVVLPAILTDSFAFASSRLWSFLSSFLPAVVSFTVSVLEPLCVSVNRPVASVIVLALAALASAAAPPALGTVIVTVMPHAAEQAIADVTLELVLVAPVAPGASRPNVQPSRPWHLLSVTTAET